MSDRAIVRILSWLAVSMAGGIIWGQSVTVTTAPGNINLTYLQGAALPSAQSISVKASAAGATYTASVVPNVPWLTVSPTSGALPAKISVRANPTGLAAGAHTVVLTFTPAVAVPPGTAGKTNLKLIVAAPAPVLTITPPSVAFANPPVPAPQTVQLKTSGGPVRFSASAGTASWLTVTPKSDVVLSGKPVTLTVTANSNLLGPQVAPYAAKITLTETGSINKKQVIVVLFTMSYQQPTVASIWPPTGRVGGPPTTVTIRGTNFGSASIAKIQGAPNVALATTYYSSTEIGAVIPASQLVSGTTLNILVTNPVPGGDSAATLPFTFTPVIDAAVNEASYVPETAPGGLITVFGENIGPVAAASLADADADGYVDISLGGVGVKVDGIDAPITYAGQHQISVQVPYGVGIGLAKTIVVTNGANPAANGTIDIAATAPGIFTLDGSGSGQAAALNYDAITTLYSENASTNPVKVGQTVVLYLTGEGTYTTAISPLDGYIIPASIVTMPTLDAAVAVTIGGQPATVSYAGPFIGGVIGVLQLDVVVPSHTAGSAVPVVVTVGGNAAQAGVVIATKP